MEGRRIANQDLRDRPAYPLAEAARYLKLPAATLRAWSLGREYPVAEGQGRFRPLIRPSATQPATLSFWNLVEAHVLRALRTEHGVSVKALRTALDYAERELRVERLLLSPELRSEAGQLFLERYGELIDLTASGQLAMKQVLAAHLRRVTWDDARFPIRLHPFVASGAGADEMVIAIDPAVSFGRPVVASRSVSTAVIVARINAGERPVDVAADYGLSDADIEQAVLYERAA